MDAEKLGEAVSLAHDVVVDWPPKQVRLSHMSLSGGWGGGGGGCHMKVTPHYIMQHTHIWVFMGIHGLH